MAEKSSNCELSYYDLVLSEPSIFASHTLHIAYPLAEQLSTAEASPLPRLSGQKRPCPEGETVTTEVDEAAEQEADGALPVEHEEIIKPVPCAVLAVKSPYFQKLFASGFKEHAEAKEGEVTIKVGSKREAEVLAEVVDFCLRDTISTPYLGDVDWLIELLVAADQYQAATCMQKCINALKAVPMTLKHAGQCLELPESVRCQAALSDLLSAARSYVEQTCQNLDKVYRSDAWKSDWKDMPASVVGVVLRNPKATVLCENTVVCMIENWAERWGLAADAKAVVSLYKLVRWPACSAAFLSAFLLSEVATSSEELRELVTRGLTFRCLRPEFKRALSFEKERELLRARPGTRTGPAELSWSFTKEDVKALQLDQLVQGSNLFADGYYWTALIQLVDGNLEFYLAAIAHKVVQRKGSGVIVSFSFTCTVPGTFSGTLTSCRRATFNEEGVGYIWGNQAKNNQGEALGLRHIQEGVLNVNGKITLCE